MNKFWRWLNVLSKQKVQENYLKRCGCDSSCPRCGKWESEDNHITTKDKGDVK